jgi:hypothetical protein
MKIPVTLCIDVEPDARETDTAGAPAWEGFEQTFELFRSLRPRIAAATGSPVRFAWFFRVDPQVRHSYGDPAWALRRYSSLIETLVAADDEIGLHTHAWRWDEAGGHWVADTSDQDWVDRCVRVGFDAFARVLGRRCRSFRFGDHWMNEATSRLVERLGGWFDLTPEPGLRRFFLPGHSRGSQPDYSDMPRQPYRPSTSDFRARGRGWRRRRLWIVPISTGLMHSPPVAGDPLRQIASVAGADYDGFLDRVDCQLISGWARDANRADDVVFVDIHIGERRIATLPADRFRPDLLRAGKGNGRHGFGLPTPSWLKDGAPHAVRATVAGAAWELHGSPKELNSTASDCGEEVLLLNSHPMFMGPSIDALLEHAARPYLALPVRTDVTLHTHELWNLQENIDFLLSHSRARQFVFEPPADLVARIG